MIRVILPVRLRLLAVLTAAFAALAQPVFAYEGPPVPDPQDLIDLVRDTVLAVDHGNKTGDYTKLRDMGSPSFQAANSSEKLLLEFAEFRAEKLDLEPVKSMTPLTTRPPSVDRNGLMRILGYFEIADRQLVYDLVYEYLPGGNRWGIVGIALKPRPLPSHPPLMQPE